MLNQQKKKMTMQPLQLIVINNDNEDEEQDEEEKEENEKEEDEGEGDELEEDVKVEPNMGKLTDKIMDRMSNINVKRFAKSQIEEELFVTSEMDHPCNQCGITEFF